MDIENTGRLKERPKKHSVPLIKNPNRMEQRFMTLASDHARLCELWDESQSIIFEYNLMLNQCNAHRKLLQKEVDNLKKELDKVL